MWCEEKSVGYGERVCEFGEVIEGLGSGAGVIYLFPFAWEFSQLGTESPGALQSFTPGETRESGHCGGHTAKRKTKQKSKGSCLLVCRVAVRVKQ